jgi:ATP-dependent RNA helicase DeaD
MNSPDRTKMTFEELGLQEELLRAVKEAGFTEPSPIQAQAIPVILTGKDLVGQAQTGTGKTAAFGLGIMNQITTIPEDGVKALILTPTRELCTQVSDELYRLGRFAGIRTVAVYGGMSIKRQVDLIERGAQIVVATPGRLLDHLLNGRLKDFNPNFVAIDEADEMLDMGFLDDVEEIFKHLPTERQTLLFSATMPTQIQRLAQKILKDPVTVKVEAKEVTAENIEQYFYVIEDWERMDAISRAIDAEDIARAIIFCRTKKDADELATALMAKGYPAKALHGDLDQRQREEVIKGFKAGKLSILVATDVAARGLDIKDVSHVFNYHIPLDPESYIHRIGRTGRAGKSGKAVTLVTPLEFRELNRIKVTTKAQIYHLEIPSIEDVQDKQALKLAEKIRHQAISDEATELYKGLLEEMDSATLALKLISKVLGKSTPTGPKTIGIRGDKLIRLIEAKNRPDDRRGGSGGKPYNKKPGGYRGGSKFDDRGGSRGGYGDRNSSGGERSSSGSSYGDRSSSGGGRSSSYGDRNSGGERSSSYGDRSGGNRSSSYGDRNSGGERSSSYGDRNSGGGSRGGYGDRSGGGDRSSSRGPRKDSDDR